MSIAIDINGLNKKFNAGKHTKVALNNVSFQVNEGEAFGFIGPNGAGKSTTIKIISGAIFATSGEASIFGKSVTTPSARQGVGFVPENPNLADYLSPLEILMDGCRLHGNNGKDLKLHCMSWLERFDLDKVANNRIRSFSKGMTQRTALAHALALKPKLLILDEPLSGLDPVGRKLVVDILRDYRKDGGTIFFSSHVLFDVERLADRFGLIHNGSLRTVRSPEDLLDSEPTFLIRSIGKQLIEGMQQDTADRWIGEVSQTNLWQMLHKLEQAEHKIAEIKPALNLESAFMRYISKSEPINNSDYNN